MKYERITKIDDLEGFYKLGNILMRLVTPLLLLILIYLESTGLSRLYVQIGFYFSISVLFLGVYLWTRSGLWVHHQDLKGNIVTTKFTGYKWDIQLLTKIILTRVKKVVDKKDEKMILHYN